MDPQTFLQSMYKEQCDQARQHETLRQQSTTITISISTAIIAFSSAAAAPVFTWLKNAQHPRFFAMYALIGCFVVGLGIFGRSLSLKHYERNRMHSKRAGAYRKELETLFGVASYGKALRDSSKKSHETEWRAHPPDKKGKYLQESLYRYWMNLYYFVIGFGVLLIIAPIAIAFM